MRWERLKTVVCVLFFAGFATACESGTFDYYAVGFSTPSGNEIWVQDVTFDDTWSVPAGSVACCWKAARKTVGVFEKPMPHSLHVQWLQRSEQRVYEATVSLTADLARQARTLPSFTWISDGEKDRGIYLIVGMESDGNVVVWLSNSTSSGNVKGRVLEVVGQTKARGRPWEPSAEQVDGARKPAGH